MSSIKPPKELDSALVLAYAILDVSVVHTGRMTLHVDGRVVDPVLRLAIARNNYDPSDFLLFYCNEAWEVIGAAGYASLAEAKERAEVAYAGSALLWQDAA